MTYIIIINTLFKESMSLTLTAWYKENYRPRCNNTSCNMTTYNHHYY